MPWVRLEPLEPLADNTVRLQAWARADTRGTFHDPLHPDAASAATVGLALRSLAQEVLLLRAQLAALEARVNELEQEASPEAIRVPALNLTGLSWGQACERIERVLNETLQQVAGRRAG